MRPITLNLNVLIRGFTNDYPWPGDEQTINLNDAACPSINGDNPVFKVESGFVVFEGESIIGEVNESESGGLQTGWTYYSQEDAAALISGWALAGLEFHSATKIYCSNNPGNFWVVSDSVYTVARAINVCCGAPDVPTNAFVFKISNKALTPGVVYECPAQAAFKWLAIKSPNEIRNLSYKFLIELTTQDGLTIINNNAAPANTLSATIQSVRDWPTDFVGLTLGSTTLIAQGGTPGPGEMVVTDFDFGTIKVTTIITDDDNGDAIVSQMEETWALPESCGIFDESFSDVFA